LGQVGIFKHLGGYRTVCVLCLILPSTVAVAFIALGVLIAGQESRAWGNEAPANSAAVLQGQERGSQQQDFFSLDNAPDEIRNAPGIPIDWSTRHVIFSSESSPETQAKFRNEPRFWIQHLSRQRSLAAFGTQSRDLSNTEEPGGKMYKPALVRSPRGPAVKIGLLLLAAVIMAGTEFIYRRKRRWALTFGLLALIALGTPACGNSYADPNASNVEGAWNQSLDQVWNIDTAHAVPYPAKYEFTNGSSASCNDWVVFTGPANGSSSTFNIIAFKNLYSGCGGPTVKFAYDGGTQGHALSTSPALSLDGTQIIYVEQGQKFMDILYLPAIDSGQGSSTWPTPNPASTLPSCNSSYPPTNTPCLYTFELKAGVTTSAPFVDYANDSCWVGDDSGNLYEITPCFKGAPPGAGTGTALTPKITPNNKEMSAPTLDVSNGNVFYSDAGGDLWSYNGVTATGTIVSSSNSADVESPVVDVTTQQVFVFSDGSPTGTNPSVVQIPETFHGSAILPLSCTLLLPSCVVGTIGTSNNTVRLGAFNNVYLNGEDANSQIPSGGLLYTCGPDNSGDPELSAFSFSSAGVMTSSPANGPLNLQTSQTKAACSPLTESDDGTTDRLFLGLVANCPAPSGGSAIPAGCIESLNITSGFPSNIPISNQAAAGGTTGIIIDNATAGSGSGNLNIYFMTMQKQSSGCSKYGSSSTDTNSSCAVSLTQVSLN
jgi:hypothetical protein